jgi:hypothetical protein
MEEALDRLPPRELDPVPGLSGEITLFFLGINRGLSCGSNILSTRTFHNSFGTFDFF